ncbi:MAG: hypothetical protein QOH25_1367, partial [Acidobacteriota bacterium]|nr:hypothetical protein [Acidobacteriota bacterium]
MTFFCSSPPVPFSRVVCLLMCYSLVSPFFALIPGTNLVAASTSSSAWTGETKTNTPRQTTSAAQETRWRVGEVLVRFKQHAPLSKISALLKQSGAHWNGQLRGQSGVVKLRLPAGLDPETIAAVLRTSELIDFAEPNYLITADQASPDDPRFSEQWAIQNTRASQTWGTTTGSKQTVIAIIDSGVDFAHPDLSNNEWDNSLEQADNRDDDSNGFTDDLHGWDFISNSGGIKDEQGHGTAIAGIIAAQGNNSVGITGIMWRAGVMSLRVLDNTGTGDIAGAVEAIDYATTNGAQVINCSWGMDYYSIALQEAISRAAKRGVVVVASAGNNSRDIETTLHYPASFDLPNLISVASIDKADLLASFSNWGATHVSIGAPGIDILTTKMGGDYQTVSGTSASAPLVTGMAGLIKTLRPWLNADRTREMILRGARRVPSLSDKVASKGIVSAAGTLEALNILPPNEGLDESEGNNGGEHSNNGNGRRNQRDNLPDMDITNGNRNRDGHEFSVMPPARTQGTPGTGLTNLDELRRKQPTNPKAAEPVPSTRCSHHNPRCDKVRHQAAANSPTDLLAWYSAISPLNSWLGSDRADLSDSPFSLYAGVGGRQKANNLASSPALSVPAASLLMPQAGGNSATYVRTDTTTQGNWKGTYGAEGYNVINDLVSYPAYAQVTPSGNLSYTWAAS